MEHFLGAQNRPGSRSLVNVGQSHVGAEAHLRPRGPQRRTPKGRLLVAPCVTPSPGASCSMKGAATCRARRPAHTAERVEASATCIPENLSGLYK